MLLVLGQDRFSAADFISGANRDICVQRQIDIHSGTELYQTDALTLFNGFIFLDPGNDSTRDQSGNESDGYFPSFRCMETDQQVFIRGGGFQSHGVDELSAGMFHELHLTAYGCVLNMDIKNGEEYGDTFTPTADIFRFGSFTYKVHGSMSRRDDDARQRGDNGSWISKEVEDESAQEDPQKNNNTGNGDEKAAYGFSYDTARDQRKNENDHFPQHPSACDIGFACVFFSVHN